ncbi:MAG: hypothetical protein RL708_1348 [Bacteroidota bacterium]|jgi:hypothetical protein
MKNKLILILSISLLTVCFFTACKKKTTTPTTTTNTTTTAAALFTFTFNGATANADSAHAYATYHTMYAYKGAKNSTSGLTDDFFEIDLDNLNVGTHSQSTTNALTYIKASGTSNVATAFSVNITANANNKMTGTFTATMTTGGAMSGTFTDMPIR